jgi:hypothetical protein
MSSLYAVIIKARSEFVTNQAQKIRTTKILFWQNVCILCTFWENAPRKEALKNGPASLQKAAGPSFFLFIFIPCQRGRR